MIAACLQSNPLRFTLPDRIQRPALRPNYCDQVFNRTLTDSKKYTPDRISIYGQFSLRPQLASLTVLPIRSTSCAAHPLQIPLALPTTNHTALTIHTIYFSTGKIRLKSFTIIYTGTESSLRGVATTGIQRPINFTEISGERKTETGTKRNKHRRKLFHSANEH